MYFLKQTFLILVSVLVSKLVAVAVLVLVSVLVMLTKCILGSWDKSARVWFNRKCTMTLTGIHLCSYCCVQCVLYYNVYVFITVLIVVYSVYCSTLYTVQKPITENRV